MMSLQLKNELPALNITTLVCHHLSSIHPDNVQMRKAIDFQLLFARTQFYRGSVLIRIE